MKCEASLTIFNAQRNLTDYCNKFLSTGCIKDFICQIINPKRKTERIFLSTDFPEESLTRSMAKKENAIQDVRRGW